MKAKPSPFEASKILINYDKIVQIRDGEMPIPRVVEILPSLKCSHTCPWCRFASMRGDQRQDFATSRLREVLSELAELGVSAIELSGGGEPTGHPDIAEIIEHARSCRAKPRMEVGLITNGQGIGDGELAQTIAEHCAFVRVAMDAGTSATYAKIHGPENSLENLCAHVEYVADLRRSREASGSEVGNLGVKFLVARANLTEPLMAARSAKEMGVDYIQFKTVRKHPQEPCSEELAEANHLISQAQRELSDDRFDVYNHTDRLIVAEKCFLTPLHPVINADGAVYLCPFFETRPDKHRIGNVHEASFKEIWFSRRHREAIESITPKECQPCDCPIARHSRVVRDRVFNRRLNLAFP